MKVTLGPGPKASMHFGGLWLLLLAAVLGAGVVAAVSAPDIQRYMRIRSM